MSTLGKQFSAEDLLDKVLTEADFLAVVPASPIGVRDLHENDLPGAATSKIVRFSHFSVQESLVSDRTEDSYYHIDVLSSYSLCVEACLSDLAHVGEEKGRIYISLEDTFPFLNYAANCWSQHLALFDGKDPQISTSLLARKFLTLPSPGWTIWSYFGFNDEEYMFTALKVSKLAGRRPYTLTGSTLIQPITWIAAMGSIYLLDLLDLEAIDFKDIPRTKYLGSPLYASAMAGHTEVVKWLLRAGAAIDQDGGLLGTALQASLYSGHIDVVEFLLNSGADDSKLLKNADVNARGGCYETALPTVNAKLPIS